MFRGGDGIDSITGRGYLCLIIIVHNLDDPLLDFAFAFALGAFFLVTLCGNGATAQTVGARNQNEASDALIYVHDVISQCVRANLSMQLLDAIADDSLLWRGISSPVDRLCLLSSVLLLTH